MKKVQAAELYLRLAELNPDPEGELEWTSPYTLLVAVALSAQATDVSVNLATRKLFKVADTPEKMLELGEEGVRKHIKTIGLFNTKAKNLLLMASQILERHGGEVPADPDALEQLAGVGRKTANVVLNIAFGLPTIAVDTHVFRVANRTGLAPGKTPLEVERKLQKVTPAAYMHHAHHWLILHGRYICKARAPECWRCAIVDLCRFRDKKLIPPKSRSTGSAVQGQ
ncbi:endonuclease III [Sphingomonas humi]|uniref:Endonuclease III n=1 Tax=Sphingomonas humi TaxID=335630 RepID=A0ABP7S160_9SPHN